VKYLKDNRILPAGFDKKQAGADVAVHGEALADEDFADGGDRVRLRVAVGSAKAPFKVEAELLFQPIGYRWPKPARRGRARAARVHPRVRCAGWRLLAVARAC